MHSELFVSPPAANSPWNGINSSSLGGGNFTLLYYIPIYFQSMLGVSAQDSGIRNLALIIAISKPLSPSSPTPH